MATVAIGDIHGNLAALLDLLEPVGRLITPDDVVVFLGDYVDRGPDSRACIESILRFRDECPAEVVRLRGNHEDWLLRTRADHSRHSWLLGMDAFETVRSYSPAAERELRDAIEQAGISFFLKRTPLPYERFFDSMPDSHHRFFRELTLSWSGDDCICTHAGLDPRVVRLADQLAESFMWGAAGFPGEYSGDATVVYGHWNNADIDSAGWPRPRVIGNTIGIDTIAHGVLTAIRLPDHEVIQSRHHAPAGGNI